MRRLRPTRCLVLIPFRVLTFFRLLDGQPYGPECIKYVLIPFRVLTFFRHARRRPDAQRHLGFNTLPGIDLLQTARNSQRLVRLSTILIVLIPFRVLTFFRQQQAKAASNGTESFNTLPGIDLLQTHVQAAVGSQHAVLIPFRVLTFFRQTAAAT